MDIQRYRKKPVEIEAMRLDGSERSAAAVAAWAAPATPGIAAWVAPGQPMPDDWGVHIETLEGTMHASPGDYVIRGVQGEFYPCKPDIFEATYDPVERTVLHMTYDGPGVTEVVDDPDRGHHPPPR